MHYKNIELSHGNPLFDDKNASQRRFYFLCAISESQGLTLFPVFQSYNLLNLHVERQSSL